MIELVNRQEAGETAVCCAPLAAPTLSAEEAELTAELFKALADPARVRIVNLLAPRRATRSASAISSSRSGCRSRRSRTT